MVISKWISPYSYNDLVQERLGVNSAGNYMNYASPSLISKQPIDLALMGKLHLMPVSVSVIT